MGTDTSDGERRAEQAALIADAVRNLEFSEYEAWADLDALSSHTRIDSIEVFEDEIRFTDGEFAGPVTIHVSLEYGSGEDRVELSESFPGKFTGRVEDDQITIDSLTVDTSGFYE